MDVAKPIGISPESVQDRCLQRTWLDVALALRITLETDLEKTSLQDTYGCGGSIWPHSNACPAQTSPRTQMDVVKTLGLTPEPILHRHLPRTQMDIARTLGFPPESVLHRRLCGIQMDVPKTLASTPESVLHKWP